MSPDSMQAASLLQAGIHTAQLFDTAQCAQWLAALAVDEHWRAARVRSKGDIAPRNLLQPTVRQAQSNELAAFPGLIEQFAAGIQAQLQPDIARHFGATVRSLDEFNAVRYPPGGRYLTHIDNGEGFRHRLFTVVCYLNDDLRGGETQFPDLGLKVVPQTGYAIAFPSEYRHAALPVIEGMKYVLVCWMQGQPTVRWI